jgi:hypothetical protein
MTDIIALSDYLYIIRFNFCHFIQKIVTFIIYLKSLNFGSYIPPTTIPFFFILTKRNYEMIVCTQQDNSLKKPNTCLYNDM